MIGKGLTRGLVTRLGRGLNKGSLSLWTPRALFSGGYKGIALDLSSKASLYQDAARTTLVSAAGDPIGSPSDLSGNGNHPTQATTTSRPLWGTSRADFDGTDDGWATPAIDFSGTDKVTVIVSVRKASDAAQGTVVSLGAGYGSQVGCFEVMASVSAGANYSFGAQGSSSARLQTDNTSFVAGTPQVLSCVFDLAQAAKETEILPRVNGAVPSLPFGAGTTAGTGNFANAVLRIGRRGGTTLPLSGGIYRMIVIGRVLTASEIASAERWCASPAAVAIP